MTPRTIHIGASFAIVLVAYWAYALLAVPWIEPPPPAPIVDIDGTATALTPQATTWRSSSRPVPGSFDKAKVINNNGQAMLLWQDVQEPRRRLGRSQAADGHLHARRDA